MRIVILTNPDDVLTGRDSIKGIDELLVGDVVVVLGYESDFSISGKVFKFLFKGRGLVL